jgi:hypothetical protein
MMLQRNNHATYEVMPVAAPESRNLDSIGSARLCRDNT